MDYQLPKGTFDILPAFEKEPWQRSAVWQFLEEVLRNTAQDFGFREIRTPIYERSELFQRSVGETSDIVTKEMFTFLDRGGRSLSLRPEGTASVIRAFLEHNLSQKAHVHKFFYCGPMFRYERPQSGRYRQFHQFGVEAIGAKDPAQDAEVIDLLCEIYRRLGLPKIIVQLNSVGDAESRQNFREALQNHLRPHFSVLSPESQLRFEKNPLRILDSKDPKDIELLAHAPSIQNFLSPASREHFDAVCRYLTQNDITYELNDKIVRGLDYYTNTVFEVTSSALGAQNAIGAGGRFDGLISSLGGPNLPAVGFALGMERALQTLLASQAVIPEETGPLLYLLPLGEEARSACFRVATACRRQKISAEVDFYSKKIQTGLQQAIRLKATLCAVVGSEELLKKTAQIKHLENHTQEEVPFEEISTYCKRFLSV